MYKKKLLASLVCLSLTGTLAGCATTSRDARDPLENWNRGVQTFNDHLDDYAMKPLAQGYQWITPSFVDRGVSNFFSNINDIGVTINDLLQFKLTQTGMDSSRFLVNTVAGVAGLVDVASMIDLPKHNEDFDQTLGYWGVSAGPYLVLPFLGPSSPRGVSGLVGDAAMNPFTYMGFGVFPGIESGLGSAISGGAFAINAVDLRADNLATEKVASEAAVDRYEFFKDAYFQRREFLIHDGKMPADHDTFDIEKEFDQSIGAPVRTR